MLSTFLAVLRRDLLLAWRGRADVLVTLAFFIIVVCLFPFGVGAEPNQLRAIAPGVLWVAALLAGVIALAIPLVLQALIDGPLAAGDPSQIWPAVIAAPTSGSSTKTTVTPCAGCSLGALTLAPMTVR